MGQGGSPLVPPPNLTHSIVPLDLREIFYSWLFQLRQIVYLACAFLCDPGK